MLMRVNRAQIVPTDPKGAQTPRRQKEGENVRNKSPVVSVLTYGASVLAALYEIDSSLKYLLQKKK